MAKTYKYFKREEYTKGRDKDAPLSPEQEDNMDRLLEVMDQFREKYGKPLSISSGYRPASINAAAGGAQKSNHISCLAVDFQDDKNRTLVKWCLANLNVLDDLGFYMEDPRHTQSENGGWVHLQLAKPKSGKRIFIP